MRKTEHPNILLIDNQGLSHYTCYLAKGLAQYKHIILLGFSKKEYVHTDASTSVGVEFRYFGAGLTDSRSLIRNLLLRPVIIFSRLFKPIIFTKYNIIHIQGHLPLFFLYIPFIRLKKAKIVWTIHDVDLRPSSKGLRGRLETLYVSLVSQPRILSSYSAKIIVHGNNLKENLMIKGIPEHRIQQIPHFDYMYLQKYSQNVINQDRGNFYILFFGNIKPYKGLEVFLKALDIVEKKISPQHLKVLIAGNGDLDPYKIFLNSEKLRYTSIRNENIPTEEIPCIFQNASIVVLPYTDASQSGIVPLSYTFSKPVIVSDIGSLGEYVENERTGYIFRRGDSEELASLIIRSINDPVSTERLGRNAYEKLISEMSLDYCCSTLNKIYDNLSSK